MTTTNKSLAVPANGSNIDDWDVPCNANWNAIDTALGGLTTLNVVSVSGTVVLNATQYTPCNIVLTGALTAAINYQFPNTVGGFWFVSNQTSGAHAITFSSGGAGTTFVVPQGTNATIACDGTNVRLADTIPTSAAGSNGQVQFNDGGVVAGSSGLAYNKSLLTLSVEGALSVALAAFVVNSSGAIITDLTITAGAQTTPVTVAFSATAMAVNCALSNVFATVFTANVTVAPTLSNPGDGQTINWFITQDATGSRTMTWPTSFKWPGGSKGVLSTAPNAVDLVVATFRASTGNWYASLAKAFA